MNFESLGQYHDYWALPILCAPDNFSDLDGVLVADQVAALDEAFDVIRAGFIFVEKKIKDPRLISVLKELIEISHEAYKAGDAMRGAHALQECEGLIWPSRRGRLKYVVEAEHRAFGVVELFKDVRVSPFPYEGTAADLGSRQQSLLRYAQVQSQPFIEGRESFKSMTWAMSADSAVRPVKAPSMRKLLGQLRVGATSGDLVACVMASFPFAGSKGIIAFDLEEVGYPHIRAIALVEDWKVGDYRFHLDEPKVFAFPVANA